MDLYSKPIEAPDLFRSEDFIYIAYVGVIALLMALSMCLIYQTSHQIIKPLRIFNLLIGDIIEH